MPSIEGINIYYDLRLCQLLEADISLPADYACVIARRCCSAARSKSLAISESITGTWCQTRTRYKTAAGHYRFCYRDGSLYLWHFR